VTFLFNVGSVGVSCFCCIPVCLHEAGWFASISCGVVRSLIRPARHILSAPIFMALEWDKSIEPAWVATVQLEDGGRFGLAFRKHIDLPKGSETRPSHFPAFWSQIKTPIDPQMKPFTNR
jgi:hypothetical protein